MRYIGGDHTTHSNSESTSHSNMNLNFRYSSDSELQRSLVLDGEVHGEFSRQRSHLERLANAKKTPLKPMKLSGPISRDKEKLLKENLFLLDELNRVRAENDDMKAKYKLMESTMSVSHNFASANVLKAKLEQARCVSGFFKSIQKTNKQILFLLEHG